MSENQVMITEKMVESYFQLHRQAKEIEKELKQLKSVFNQFFDFSVGKNQKGELSFTKYQLTRHIRVSEKYDEEQAVHRLEVLNLSDCIKVEKRVDDEKVKAAISLGILDQDVLEEYRQRKYSSAIYVKER